MTKVGYTVKPAPGATLGENVVAELLRGVAFLRRFAAAADGLVRLLVNELEDWPAAAVAAEQASESLRPLVKLARGPAAKAHGATWNVMYGVADAEGVLRLIRELAPAPGTGAPGDRQGV